MAEVALVMVSWVVKVLEAMMKRVVSTFRIYVFHNQSLIIIILRVLIAIK